MLIGSDFTEDFSSSSTINDDDSRSSEKPVISTIQKDNKDMQSSTSSTIPKNPKNLSSGKKIKQKHDSRGSKNDNNIPDIAFSRHKHRASLPTINNTKGCFRILHNYSKVIVHSVWFDRIVLSFIGFNTLEMTLSDPLKGETSLGNLLEHIFLSIFFLEMAIKMFALGIMDKSHGYFSNKWNWLDFTVVSSASAQLLYVLITGKPAAGGSGFVFLR